MHYELAKELKDAGFPQAKGEVDGFQKPKDLSPTMMLGVPLSELIEACGDDFVHLDLVSPEVWKALALGGAGEGKTPEEAVARLWLALNQ